MRKSYKATGVLLASTAGFFLLHPYGDSFWGGLLGSGFGAAMIGGLADWFAVTALFHKPLGISYRTEILLRNRHRLMQALLSFVGSDLLSVKHMMKVIGQENMSEMILQYLDKFNGREKVKQISGQLLEAILLEAKAQELACKLALPVRKGLLEADVIELLLKTLRSALQPKYSDRLVFFLSESLKKLVAEEAVQNILQKHIAVIREAYIKDSPGRQMIIEMFDLSEEKLTKIFTGEILRYLEKIKDPDHSLHQKIQLWLTTQIGALEEDENFHRRIRQWQQDTIEFRLPVEEKLTAFFAEQMQWHPDKQSLFASGLQIFFDDKIGSFEKNIVLQQRFDQRVKEMVEKFLDNRHDLLLQVIQERLDAFSDTEMVSFVENKVFDDLQMIRINGALVGSLVGMGLYLFTALAERLWNG